MPIRDAWRMVSSADRDRVIQVYLKPAQGHVWIRPGTSDVECLKKVFLEIEYALPFDFSPRLIVDAGANIGMATLYFASKFPNAKIVAVEPEQSNFEILYKNCAHLPNVTLIQAALWPLEEPVWIENPADDKWSFAVSRSAVSAAHGLSVPAVTVSTLLQKSGCEQIDWLKLDIEGAESELFSTNVEPWIKKVKIITIELHDFVREGCSRAFYSAIMKRKFKQVTRGETIIVKFDD